MHSQVWRVTVKLTNVAIEERIFAMRASPALPEARADDQGLLVIAECSLLST